MHPKRWLCAVLLCSFALVIQAQDPVFRVRVDVPVVALEAVVKDSNDRPLTHLSQADLKITRMGRSKVEQSRTSYGGLK